MSKQVLPVSCWGTLGAPQSPDWITVKARKNPPTVLEEKHAGRLTDPGFTSLHVPHGWGPLPGRSSMRVTQGPVVRYKPLNRTERPPVGTQGIGGVL
ncbi:unnamed protein product [Boreogadus saida]